MKKVILLAIVCLLGISYQTRASHVVGADISYVNVGPNQFKFTLKLFRDCAGIDVRNFYDIDYQSLSCNKQGSFRVYQVRKAEVSPVCPAAPSNCQGGSNPGVEMYIFEGTVTVPDRCSDWVFSWNKRDEYRNNAITNINDPGNTGLYVEATLNNIIAPTNNSPEFTNIPVSYLNLNQRNAINPGANDSDKDSLVFSIISPMSGKGATVSYKSPFTASNPLSSSPAMSISRSSGAINIHPTAEQISVTAILVQEYRGGQLIGSVVRDIQLIAEDYTNENPVIGGINGTSSRSIEVCPGDSVCFNIPASDPDGHNISLTKNSVGLPSNITFAISGSGSQRSAYFCWPNASVGTYYFTVTATDDNCPVTGQNTETFEIIVYPRPLINLPPKMTIACNTSATLNPNVTSGTSPFTYRWSTGETTPTVSKGAGVYSLQVTDFKGCKSSHTIEVASGIAAGYFVVAGCETDSIAFRDTSKTSNGTIVKWEWNFGDPTSTHNTSNLQHPKHVFENSGTYTVSLTVEDNTGCRASVSKDIRICDRPIANFVKLDSCKFKTLPIQDSTESTCGLKYYELWVNGALHIRENFTVITHPYYPLYFPGSQQHGHISHSIIPKDTGWYEVRQVVTNEYNCVETITKRFYVYDNPYIDIAEPDSFFLCNKPEIVFHAINMAGGTEPVRWFWNNGSTADSLLTTQQGRYVVKIVDKLGCDTSAVRYVKDPLTPMFHNSIFCNPDDHIRFTDHTTTRWGVVRWKWDFGDGNVFETTNPTLKNPDHHYAVDNLYW